MSSPDGTLERPPAYRIEERVDLPKAYLDRLVLDRERLAQDNEQLRKENHDLLIQYKDRVDEIHELEVRLKELDQLHRKDIAALQKENEILKQLNKELTEKLSLLEEKVTTLEANVSRLSLREAMRALENYCVYEVLESKNKMVRTKVYTISALVKLAQKDPNVKTRLAQFTDLTDEDFMYLKYFKEVGDEIVHKEYVKLVETDSYSHISYVSSSKEALLTLEEDDQDAQRSKEKMLTLLETYCKKHSKPFGKTLL